MRVETAKFSTRIKLRSYSTRAGAGAGAGAGTGFDSYAHEYAVGN